MDLRPMKTIGSVIAFILVAVLSFSITHTVKGSLQKESKAVFVSDKNLSSDRGSSSDSAAPQVASSPSLPASTTEVTRPLAIAGETEWEHLVRTQSGPLSATSNALGVAALLKSSEQQLHPYECDVDGELKGHYAFRFETQIQSTAREVSNGEWFFVEDRDGRPVPERIQTCLTTMLEPNLRVARKPDEPAFLEYKGTFPLYYRVTFPDVDTGAL